MYDRVAPAVKTSNYKDTTLCMLLPFVSARHCMWHIQGIRQASRYNVPYPLLSIEHAHGRRVRDIITTVYGAQLSN